MHPFQKRPHILVKKQDSLCVHIHSAHLSSGQLFFVLQRKQYRHKCIYNPRWNTTWGVGRRFLYLQNGSPRSTSYILVGYDVQRKPFFLQNGRTSQVFATEWWQIFLVNGSFRVRQLGNALCKMVGPWTRFSESTRTPPDPKDSPIFPRIDYFEKVVLRQLSYVFHSFWLLFS